MATTLASIRQQARALMLETLALTTPGSPLVAPQGTPGATTITYKIVATNASGHSEASQGTTIATAAATLTGVNFNQINWQAVPNASGYDIYRTATNGVSPVTLGKIGSTTTTTTFNDTGLAGDAVTAPTLNTSGINSPFWTEQELLDTITHGAQDLWKSIVDLHEGHFVTINDAQTVIYPAGASGVTTQFTGIPTDCFRILMVEPHDLGASGSSPASGRYFKPMKFNSQNFQAARGMSVQDSTNFLTVYYDILNAGSPVVAPTLVGAPPVSSAVPIRLTYVRTLGTLLETDSNPIPGEADNALIAWTIAYSYAKQREDRSPDPGWLAVYSTEKQQLLKALSPRQEQEEQVAEGLFDGLMEDW
jgi:hypothetical protein